MKSAEKNGRHAGQGRAAGKSDAGAIATTTDYTANRAPVQASNRKLRRAESYRPMPLHVFPLVLRDFITNVARVKDVDPAAVALPVLAVLSSAVGNSRRLQLRNDYRPPAVLWPVLVAGSGDGKSPGMDAAMRPIIAAQNEAAKQHAQEVAEHAEQMREWRNAPNKRTRGDEPPAPPAMRHYYIDNATTEVVAVRLRETPRGLLCAVDEFAGLVGNFNAYKKSGSDKESWLSFYDARASKIDRKTSIPPTIYIPQAFVAATGTIQPSTLRETLGGNMIGSGFAARLLLAMPPARQRKWCDDDVPVRITNSCAELIGNLYKINCPDKPELIKPSQPAMAR